MWRTEPGDGGGVENARGLAEEWGKEENAGKEEENRICFPRFSELHLLVSPLFSFHPPWTMQGGLETGEKTKAQRDEISCHWLQSEEVA